MITIFVHRGGRTGQAPALGPSWPEPADGVAAAVGLVEPDRVRIVRVFAPASAAMLARPRRRGRI
jgi:hypothetical protein